ncbi:ATP-binding protein [Neobacillus kokaensis]|uniref:ATP-binding protein n=1 Tax=Neobacillus kokaensis TaxID=2759023 RepID=A0ABQ3MZT7_9BACI|nr:ATP-binding protein [Neobacillus kokaensis]GHH96837.1 hypothetical protein AM1BK_03800 [Neobacillus kokaensis]
MRNVLTLPFEGGSFLIISSDNSGAIGMKEHDHVHVPYETVAYYSFRVAAMECIAAGGAPVSVVLHNFCGNEPWEELVKGVQKGLFELGLFDVSITGSTESNFQLMQSAFGVIVIGKKTADKKSEIQNFNSVNLAVIGQPLVGDEVIQRGNEVVPLSVFLEVSKLNGVLAWPVGSKGILYELQRMFPELELTKEKVESDVDLCKSSGPATCFICTFNNEQKELLNKLAENFIHSLKINSTP